MVGRASGNRGSHPPGRLSRCVNFSFTKEVDPSLPTIGGGSQEERRGTGWKPEERPRRYRRKKGRKRVEAGFTGRKLISISSPGRRFTRRIGIISQMSRFQRSRDVVTGETRRKDAAAVSLCSRNARSSGSPLCSARETPPLPLLACRFREVQSMRRCAKSTKLRPWKSDP